MSVVCHVDFDALGPNLRGALQRPRPSQTFWGPETAAGKRILEELEGNQRGNDSAGSKEERERKKRRSRWEPHVEKAIPGLPGISLPPSLAGIVDVNLEVLDLQRELNSINDKIQFLSSGRQLDLKKEEDRSPSPEPMYNPEGIRVNTREQRLKDKMIKERQRVIQELIMKNPQYKPPSDFRPEKKTRKIYIPVNENPGYNFIGLIIGPRGNTQKRMEKATGTKIAIRGKGSLKEGRVRKEFRSDTSEDEPLHVLIAGDSEDAVDKAAEMITKLLVPMDEVSNEHKRNQLRELAELNGTLRDFEQWDKRDEDLGIYKLPEKVQAHADRQYQKDLVSVNPEEAGKMENEFQSFMRELGGNDILARGSFDGRNVQDPTNLYVGFIPSRLTDSELEALFKQCGEVVHCQIIHDRQTGQSRGFGFVKMRDQEAAERAIQKLHDHHIDKRRLVVRYKGEGPPPTRTYSNERQSNGQTNPKSPPEKPAQLMGPARQVSGVSEGQWDVDTLNDERPPGVDEPFSLPGEEPCPPPPPPPPPLPMSVPQWISPQPDAMFAGHAYPHPPDQGNLVEAFEPRPPGEELEVPGIAPEVCVMYPAEAFEQSYPVPPESTICSAGLDPQSQDVLPCALAPDFRTQDADHSDVENAGNVKEDNAEGQDIAAQEKGPKNTEVLHDLGMKEKAVSNTGKKKSEKGSKKSKSTSKKRKLKSTTQAQATDLEEGEIPVEPGEASNDGTKGHTVRRKNGHWIERGMRSDMMDEWHHRHNRDSPSERRRFGSSHARRRY